MSTESAFPTIVTERHTSKYSNEVFSDTYSTGGMSLLDWFAGQALKGIITNPENGGTYEAFAKEAYGYAEAMMLEKERREHGNEQSTRA